MITETEVMMFLGARSVMRRFTLEFELLLEKLPFKVRIEPGDSGKRYVREESR